MTSAKSSALDQALKIGTLSALLYTVLKSIVSYWQFYESPILYFKNISALFFGDQVFTTGTTTGWALSGFVFHFLIFLFVAVLLFSIYNVFKKIFRNKYLIGIIYGIQCSLFLYLIIIPTIFKATILFDFSKITIAAMLFIAAIGLPVSLIADKYYFKKS